MKLRAKTGVSGDIAAINKNSLFPAVYRSSKEEDIYRELAEEVRQLLPYLSVYAAIHGDYLFRKVKSSVSAIRVSLLLVFW